MSDKPSCYFTSVPISNEHFNLEHNPARREAMTRSDNHIWIDFDVNRLDEAIEFETIGGAVITDLHYFVSNKSLCPVLGINEKGEMKSWSETGICNPNIRAAHRSGLDLQMLIETRGGWINIYKGGIVSHIHATREIAEQHLDTHLFLATIAIEY